MTNECLSTLARSAVIPDRVRPSILWRTALLGIVCVLPGCTAPPTDADVAFVGVNVLPMDTERVVADVTVLVRDGRIVAVGPRDAVGVADDATVVDGTGRYLVPGVAEMHGHYPNPNARQFAEDVLFLYVANGVTLVRGMQGSASHVPLRDAIEARELIGPRLLVCAPAMGGASVATVEDAERLVREAKAAGVDHLKVHEGLTPQVYAAIARTAKEVSLPFSGHVSNLVGLMSALEQGQRTIDHLDNLIEAMVDDQEAVRSAGLFDLPALVPKIDASKMDDVVQAIRDAGAGVVPTEVLWEVYLGGEASEALVASRPELPYWIPQGRQGIGAGVAEWVAQADERRRAQSSPGAGRAVIDLRRRLIKALHDAGVPVLLGTDSPQVFSVPGFSIHHEMRVMAESGLTPYEVLRSGTAAVAEFYGATDFGRIAEGQRADLVLLNANPLDDIGHFRDNAGVMVNGQWLSRDTIDTRLAEIRARMAAGQQ